MTNGKLEVHRKRSKIDFVTCRLPQGSFFRPLLFIICVNDLCLHMTHCDVHMYADSTSFMFASDSIMQINDFLNDEPRNLKSWLQANKLYLNVAKAQIFVICTRKRLKDISGNSAARPSFVVDEENVTIDDKLLSWHVQIVAVKKKVSRGLGMLRFTKQYLPIAKCT